MVLAAFSALNCIVSICADGACRTTFLEPALGEVRRGFEVRDEYATLRSRAHDPARWPFARRRPCGVTRRGRPRGDQPLGDVANGPLA